MNEIARRLSNLRIAEISRKQSGQPPSYQTVNRATSWSIIKMWRSLLKLATVHADAVEVGTYEALDSFWNLLKKPTPAQLK